MTYNEREKNGKITALYPTPRQNKYLLSIGDIRRYGSNYNGYGYQDWTRVYILTPAQMREYNRIGRIVPKKSTPLTEEQKQLKWSVRLAKLTGIPLDEAKKIAQEKIDYQFDCVQTMIERNFDCYSARRAKLINKMERENPLRYIQDAGHAQAILAASRRHNDTDYEDKLDEARELAELGDIDRGDIKEYARNNFSKKI